MRSHAGGPNGCTRPHDGHRSHDPGPFSSISGGFAPTRRHNGRPTELSFLGRTEKTRKKSATDGRRLGINIRLCAVSELIAEVEDFRLLIQMREREQRRLLANLRARPVGPPTFAAIWNNPEDAAYDAYDFLATFLLYWARFPVTRPAAAKAARHRCHNRALGTIRDPGRLMKTLMPSQQMRPMPRIGEFIKGRELGHSACESQGRGICYKPAAIKPRFSPRSNKRAAFGGSAPRPSDFSAVSRPLQDSWIVEAQG